MSLTPRELAEHVEAVATSARLRGRIVVLCEGDLSPRSDGEGRPSPQSYRRNALLPDSSFYRAALSRAWQGFGLPRFVNCGGRTCVLRTLAGIRQFHKDHPDRCHVDPEKIFAYIDADIQPCDTLGLCQYDSTEEVFLSLYVDLTADQDLRVWVTPVVHKEALFLLPLHGLRVEDSAVGLAFDDGSFDLRQIHLSAAARLHENADDPDRDGITHFHAIRARLSACYNDLGIDTDTATAFSESWPDRSEALSGDDYRVAVEELFRATKAKPLWKRVTPPVEAGWHHSDQAFRDQLSLLIARRISLLAPDEHPVARFLEYLRTSVR